MLTSLEAPTLTLAWIVIAIAAIGIEVAVTNFTFMFIALAALVAGALAALGLGLPVQFVTFALSAWLMPVLLRKQMVRRFSGRGIPSRTDRLIGATGEVTEPLDTVRGTGRVVVNGQDWAARGASPMPAGSKIEVVEADGIVLVVRAATAR